MTQMSRKQAAEDIRARGKGLGDGELEFVEEQEVYSYTETYGLPDGSRARLRWFFEPLEVKRKGRIQDPSEYPYGNGTAECLEWDDPSVELLD